MKDTVVKDDKRFIADCLQESDRSVAAQRLFDRYYPFIIKWVKKYLDKFGTPVTEDATSTVVLKLYEKAIFGTVLESLHKADNLNACLATIIKHTVIDCYRGEKRNADILNPRSGADVVSKEEPIRGTDGLNYEYTLSSDDTPPSDFVEAAEKILDRIDAVMDRNFLILRVAIMFHDPLPESCIKQIAVMRGVSADQIRIEIDELMDRLVERHSARVKNEERLKVLLVQIIALERRLDIMREDPLTSDTLLQQVKTAIQHKRAQRRTLLTNRPKRYLRPTSKQIAELLGITAITTAAINVILFRVTKALKASTDAANGAKKSVRSGGAA